MPSLTSNSVTRPGKALIRQLESESTATGSSRLIAHEVTPRDTAELADRGNSATNASSLRVPIQKWVPVPGHHPWQVYLLNAPGRVSRFINTNYEFTGDLSRNQPKSEDAPTPVHNPKFATTPQHLSESGGRTMPRPVAGAQTRCNQPGRGHAGRNPAGRGGAGEDACGLRTDSAALPETGGIAGPANVWQPATGPGGEIFNPSGLIFDISNKGPREGITPMLRPGILRGTFPHAFREPGPQFVL